jgi:CheY-like chemotaxis protein
MAIAPQRSIPLLIAICFGDCGFFFSCLCAQAVMNGLECTRIIRTRQKANEPAPFIIAQTANASEEWKAACLNAGMSVHRHALLVVPPLTALVALLCCSLSSRSVPVCDCCRNDFLSKPIRLEALTGALQRAYQTLHPHDKNDIAAGK